MVCSFAFSRVFLFICWFCVARWADICVGVGVAVPCAFRSVVLHASHYGLHWQGVCVVILGVADFLVFPSGIVDAVRVQPDRCTTKRQSPQKT